MLHHSLLPNDITHAATNRATFAGRVRCGKIMQPTARGFDPAVWSKAHADHRHNTRDDRLHEAGLWFHAALALRWKSLEQYHLNTLPVDSITRRLAAIANQHHLLVEAHLLEATLQRQAGNPPEGSLAQLRFELDDNPAVTADMLRTSVLDTLGKLAQIVRAEIANGTGRGRFDPEAFLGAIPIFEDIYLLEYFWGRLLWLGWSIEWNADEVRLVGADSDALEASFAIANWRRHNLLTEFDLVYRKEWAAADSRLPGAWDVTALKRAKGYKFRVGWRRPGEGNISPAYLLREMLCVTELAPILHEPLPRLEAGLTLDDLLSAWEMLALAARSIEQELFLRGPSAPIAKFAPTLHLDELDKLLASLDWPKPKRSAALDFFTFKSHSQDALWARPLLPLRDGSVVFVLTPLTCPNLYRTAELWVTLGAGEDLFRNRGSNFETKLRTDILAALPGRPWRDRVAVVRDPWVPKINGVTRDIDLVIRIDNFVFIGELKLKKFPVSAAEIGRHADEFVHAASQIDIRLPWMEAHKVELAKKTGWMGPPDALQLFGMIVTGTGFASGTAAGGYPIIDSDALLFFFEQDRFVAAGEVVREQDYDYRPRDPAHSINLVDANIATSFLAYVRHPWHVRFAEAGLKRETRSGRLHLTQQTLRWPDHHLDDSIFGTQSVNQQVDLLRLKITQWRAEAQNGAACSDQVIR